MNRVELYLLSGSVYKAINTANAIVIVVTIEKTKEKNQFFTNRNMAACIKI